jgi:hypothetical protein
MTDTELQQVIKDTAYMVANSTNKEHSRFISELRDNNTLLVNEFNLFKQEVREYIKRDDEWKETAMPVIEMGKNVQGFGKVSLYILGFLASVSAGFYTLMAFLKKN